MRGPSTCAVGTGAWFTKTAVPRFDGNGSWQQHLQIFNTIAKSNGWMYETPGLQLFVHLEGEALNVALLMSEGERANWEGLLRGLSNYYNSRMSARGLHRRNPYLVCNELRGIMARSTQNPNMITRSTIIYETVSPGAAGINIYI